MKNKFGIVFLLGIAGILHASAEVIPEDFACEVKPLYGYKADRSAGRLINVNIKGTELKGNIWVDVAYKKLKETSSYQLNASDSTSIEVLLPSSLPTDKIIKI